MYVNGESTLSYFAYGLGIHSAIRLPELLTEERAADVVIHRGDLKEDLPPEAVAQGLYATAEGVHLFWEDAGAFLVREGREIVVDSNPGVEEEDVRLIILGPGLGALLYQRGLLVLHASAVAIAGGVVAFMGERGVGKSTMAAIMYHRGHSLVADDVTAVQAEADAIHPTVFPGFPQLKLWPEAAGFLGEDLATLPRLHPEVDKRARRAADQFSLASLPLKYIYVLTLGETEEIEPLGPQEALVELVRHSYGRRLHQATAGASHFLQCASVVNSVPIRRLRRSRSLPALSELARLVEEDVAKDYSGSQRY